MTTPTESGSDSTAVLSDIDLKELAPAIFANGFELMELSPSIQKALAALNFTEPTPIQSQAIPLVLKGRDLIGCAQTGTGKTAAFCLPMLMRLEANPDQTAVILCPTRELAFQIEEVLRKLARYLTKMNLALLIGGSDMRRQYKALHSGARIIIATPGRLMDHLKRGNVSLESTSVLVLDEADRMLDMGFSKQLDEILRFLPRERQTLLFSATLPSDIQKLALKYLQNPERVTVGSTSKPIDQIQQTAIQVTRANKNDTLMNELNTREGTVIIFAKTQHGTDRLANVLEEYGYSVGRIHGGRTQGQRNAALQGFRGGRFRILVATDVAARGLDIPHIAHVINYDLPQTPEDYIHRIGRTARAGQTGDALCLLLPEENGEWKRICRYCKQDIAIVGAVNSGSSRGGSRGGYAGRDRNERSQDRYSRPSAGARFGSRDRDSRPENRSNGPRSRNAWTESTDAFKSNDRAGTRPVLGVRPKPRTDFTAPTPRPTTPAPQAERPLVTRAPIATSEGPKSSTPSWAEKTRVSRDQQRTGSPGHFRSDKRKADPFGFEDRPTPSSRARPQGARREAPVWSDERPRPTFGGAKRRPGGGGSRPPSRSSRPSQGKSW